MRELDKPVSQFPHPHFIDDFVLTEINSFSVESESPLFERKLMFFRDLHTNVLFLADTGSVPNLMTTKVAKKFYPDAWTNRLPYKVKLSGVGGSRQSSFLIRISREDSFIPFIVGEDVPLNIIGFSWIQKVSGFQSFKDESLDPSFVIRNPSLLSYAAWPVAKAVIKDYHVKENPNAAEIKSKLEELRKAALNQEIAKEFDQTCPENALIPEKDWKGIWKSYEKELSNVKKHLREPQKLPFKCEITLKNPNVSAIQLKPFPVSDPVRIKAIKELLENLWDWHVIEEGPSDWKLAMFTIANRVTEHQKKNKGYIPSYRVVQDLRPLNKEVKDIECVIPRIKDVFKQIKGRPVLSVIDFTKAYYHMKCTNESKRYCGISGTPYRWDSMPLGLKTAPALWMKNMHELIKLTTKNYQQRMLSKGRTDDVTPLVLYIDDCLLHTRRVEDHLELLKAYFEECQKMALTISIHKSFIGKKRVHILGSEVGAEKIEAQRKRLTALLAIPPPRNIAEVRSWLGALRFASQHIPGLNKLLHPFDIAVGGTSAAKGPSTPVMWTENMVDTYEQVKMSLEHPKSLFVFDEDLPTFVETDASEVGFGAVIFQQKGTDSPRPLSYYSESWKTNIQRTDNACFRELLALKNTLVKHQDLLKGIPFTIITDNMGVFHLLKSLKSGTKKIARWLNIIASFPFNKVLHKSTDEMYVSDGLSRSLDYQDTASVDDPDLLPVFNVFPKEDSKRLIRHLRHSDCPCKYHKECLLQMFADYDWDMIISLAEESDRCTITEKGIVANHGHTTSRLPNYEPFVHTGEQLYHFTTERSLPSILINGLKPMSRKFVHLTFDKNDKHHLPVKLKIKRVPKGAYRSLDNNVVLSPAISPSDLEIQKKYCVMSWNVNGIRSLEKKGDFQKLFASDPDVIFLQEIKCPSENLPGIPKNYKGIVNSGKKQGYSGTAIIFKKDIPIKEEKINFEGCYTTL